MGSNDIPKEKLELRIKQFTARAEAARAEGNPDRAAAWDEAIQAAHEIIQRYQNRSPSKRMSQKERIEHGKKMLAGRKNARAFTAEDDAYIKKEWEAGTALPEICKAIGRPKSSVYARALALTSLKR